MPKALYDETLSILIHGEHGVGKSTLANTAPGPRLVLDAEGGSRFQRASKVVWDPAVEGPPEVDGTWEMCLVFVRDYKTVQLVYNWLASGRHGFKSLVIDSITEIQKRLIDQVAGTEQLRTQDWGEVLRTLEDYVRRLRDLTFHPTNPLSAVVVVGLTHLRDGKFRASLQGKLELNLPSYVDVVGYLYIETLPDNQLARRLLIAPMGAIDAKDRTGVLTETYGVILPEPNISTMLTTINTALGVGNVHANS